MTAGLRHVFIEIGQQGLAPATGFLAQGQHRIELVLLKTLVALVALGVLQHLLEHQHVLQPVSHPGVCRQAVTAGATGLLVVGFQRLGQVHVGHEAHVGLVDAHAEGNGGHHDQAFFIEEALLVIGPQLIGQPGMVGQRGEALLAEKCSHFVDLFARQAIDDPGIAAPLVEEGLQLLAWLLLGHDAIEDVRPVEAGEKTLGVLQVQAIDDLFPGALVSRGGQGNARHLGEHFRQLPQLQVFGAEVVAPLGHTVGFINREQGDFQALQKRQHARLDQALGGQVEHLHFAAPDTRGQVTLLLGAEGGVQGCRRDTEFLQGRNLVVHQRDQRRNHHRQPFAK